MLDALSQFFTNETLRQGVYDAGWAVGEAAVESAKDNVYGIAIGGVVIALGSAALAVHKYGMPTLPTFSLRRSTATQPTSTKTEDKQPEVDQTQQNDGQQNRSRSPSPTRRENQ